jgi:UDP-GlcNAc:undecaprenyl-phosphate GlcNAc-1-phosphate transferase
VLNYAEICALSALFSFALGFPVRSLAAATGAVDAPGERRLHAEATPRLGGLSVFGAIFLTLVMENLVGRYPWSLVAGLTWPLALGAAVTLIATVGVVDDWRSLRPAIKLSTEIIAGLLVVNAGCRVESMLGVKLGWLGGLATIFWIVLLTNAVNMVDGLDGLLAGTGLIMSATLFAISIHSVNILPCATILAALCGALGGFLWHNFHPARIFLGDSGSLLIGFVLAVAAIQISNQAPTPAASLFPFMILGLPLLELVLTVLRRFQRSTRQDSQDSKGLPRSVFSFARHLALFTPDQDHLHHRLLGMGFSYRSVLLILYGVCTALCVAVLLLLAYHITRVSFFMTLLAVVFFAASRSFYPELRPLSAAVRIFSRVAEKAPAEP